jgi:hypothetical protein
MKPGHTIFFERGNGYKKAVVHIAVGFDPNEKNHAIDLTSAFNMSALNKFEVFNIKQGRDFANHEKKYMNSNSKLYDRRSK